MTLSPFFPTFEKLPTTLPIFPLENAVVMPQVELPLNIFEPRYLNMVNDVLASHRLIGMVQPVPDEDDSEESIYLTGCAGRVTSYSETIDGRIVIVLTGVCRFDIGQELPSIRGYRVVTPVWKRFRQDLEGHPDKDEGQKDELLSLLKRYFMANRLSTDWKSVERLSTVSLVHTMTSMVPLNPLEKQTILEAEALSDRTNALRTALEFELRESLSNRKH